MTKALIVLLAIVSPTLACIGGLFGGASGGCCRGAAPSCSSPCGGGAGGYNGIPGVGAPVAAYQAPVLPGGFGGLAAAPQLPASAYAVPGGFQQNPLGFGAQQAQQAVYGNQQVSGGYASPAVGGGQGGYGAPAVGGGQGGYAAPAIGGGQEGYGAPAIGGGQGGYAAPAIGGGQGGYAAPAIGGGQGGYAAPAIGEGQGGYAAPAVVQTEYDSQVGGGQAGYVAPSSVGVVSQQSLGDYAPVQSVVEPVPAVGGYVAPAPIVNVIDTKSEIVSETSVVAQTTEQPAGIDYKGVLGQVKETKKITQVLVGGGQGGYDDSENYKPSDLAYTATGASSSNTGSATSSATYHGGSNVVVRPVGKSTVGNTKTTVVTTSTGSKTSVSTSSSQIATGGANEEEFTEEHYDEVDGTNTAESQVVTVGQTSVEQEIATVGDRVEQALIDVQKETEKTVGQKSGGLDFHSIGDQTTTITEGTKPIKPFAPAGAKVEEFVGDDYDSIDSETGSLGVPVATTFNEKNGATSASAGASTSSSTSTVSSSSTNNAASSSHTSGSNTVASGSTVTTGSIASTGSAASTGPSGSSSSQTTHTTSVTSTTHTGSSGVSTSNTGSSSSSTNSVSTESVSTGTGSSSTSSTDSSSSANNTDEHSVITTDGAEYGDVDGASYDDIPPAKVNDENENKEEQVGPYLGIKKAAGTVQLKIQPIAPEHVFRVQMH